MKFVCTVTVHGADFFKITNIDCRPIDVITVRLLSF